MAIKKQSRKQKDHILVMYKTSGISDPRTTDACEEPEDQDRDADVWYLPGVAHGWMSHVVKTDTQGDIGSTPGR